jgi:hypothetical protein
MTCRIPALNQAMAVLAFTLLVSCTSTSQQSSPPVPFKLSEESAVDRLMATQLVARLEKAIPHRHLICMVEGRTSDEIDLYLGDDEGDHTTRIGAYRVTGDGRVWAATLNTPGEYIWVAIS